MNMAAEALGFLSFLFENCTGVVLTEQVAFRCLTHSADSEESPLIPESINSSDELEEFTKFDTNDTIFREFDPPEGEGNNPKSWKHSLPSFRVSLWQCFVSVVLIQLAAGTVIGLLAVFLAFLDFTTGERCYEETTNWNNMPPKVQSIRVTAQTVEGFIIQMWGYLLFMTIFPWPLLKELKLLTFNLLTAFLDVTYRLYFQLYGIYKIHWMSFPLNFLYAFAILVNSFLVGRHFSPGNWRNALRIDFVLSAQFIIGVPISWIVIYSLMPWYSKQEESMKVIIAGFCPLVSILPKIIARLGAQHLNVIHPGKAYVLAVVAYGASAITFRIMQGELSNVKVFVAVGIAHSIVDMLERLTITMRDEIWEYLYRFISRQERRPRKYRSPRSRRFIADLSIHLMLQESTSLVAALGFIYVYHFMFTEKPFTDYTIVYHFLIRSAVSLIIDLFFNTISLLIQTRVMNVAVNRVWRKKWRHHLLVNTIVISIVMLYFTEYLFGIVRMKYKYETRHRLNCTDTAFLVT